MLRIIVLWEHIRSFFFFEQQPIILFKSTHLSLTLHFAVCLAVRRVAHPHPRAHTGTHCSKVRYGMYISPFICDFPRLRNSDSHPPHTVTAMLCGRKSKVLQSLFLNFFLSSFHLDPTLPNGYPDKGKKNAFPT